MSGYMSGGTEIMHLWKKIEQAAVFSDVPAFYSQKKTIPRFLKSIIFILIGIPFNLSAQDTICLSPAIAHEIESKELGETRSHWVKLPLHYSDTLSYPVIYVLDAEWRFELVSHLAFDLGGHDKIRKSIIVGIPHINLDKRGIDLTFSHSRVEYDGEAVDSTFYNRSNSGGAERFYKYLTTELIPDVNRKYPTSDHESLIGHSYGGYFGGYILSLDHPFEVIHMYDPSIWYSNCEVTTRISKTKLHKPVKVYLTYQPEPEFHKLKIEELISELSENDMIELLEIEYRDETHYSLFLDSFYHGIQITNVPKIITK